MFCTRCNINWAKLHDCSDDVNDETYEYCPKCGSDYFLEPKREGDLFICDSFTGRIKNITAPAAAFIPAAPAEVAEAVKFDRDAWMEKQDKIDQEQDAAIAEYIRIYNSEGKEAAEKAFLKL